jgi:hypothetical protein
MPLRDKKTPGWAVILSSGRAEPDYLPWQTPEEEWFEMGQPKTPHLFLLIR